MSPMNISRRGALLAGAIGAVSVPLMAGQAFADVGNKNAMVYIDPGHGGSDTGATGHGLVEKDLCLDIALQTRDMLVAKGGVDVRMSRTDDATLSLDARTNDANSWGAALFVSIHINAGGGTGFESYRYPSAGEPTVGYHNTLHPAILGAMNSHAGVVDRGPKTANFHVLRESAMPAILTENLFIDQADDAGKLADPGFITATARGHADGIAQIFGL
ncbi:MAG TPA: N-acetylmuramoyl-L-alanine amidase [Candidatus Stackebrandtia faecavium]|nr:N-acetylmuramoyl-L-alanine amidase [Candidatus Stackebrandtia faecavium]